MIDLNYILMWFVALSLIMSFVNRARFGNRMNTWFLVNVVVAVLTIVIFQIRPEFAGYVGGLFWFLWVLVPISLLKRINQNFFQQDFIKAAKQSSVLVFLHPTNEMRRFSDWLNLMAQVQLGEVDVKELEKFDEHQSQAMRMYQQFFAFRMSQDWSGFLAWADRMMDPKVVDQPSFIAMKIRAFGEVGQPEQMVGYLMAKAHALATLDPATKAIILSFMFGFFGEEQHLERLFADPIMVLPDNIKSFWKVTAKHVASNRGPEGYYENYLKDSDPILVNAANNRLEHPLKGSEHIDPAIKAVFAELSRHWLEEIANGTSEIVPRRPTLTYILMGLNGLFFALEYAFGGTENLAVLTYMGALIPKLVWESGEWWRVLTANFLHFGTLHFGMNMFALYYLGPEVESQMKKFRFLIIYMGAGLFGMFVAGTIGYLIGFTSQIMVGASGCIMGLVGALAYLNWQRWRFLRTKVAHHQMLTILIIIGFQFVFDLSTPQVSFTVHTAGLISGLFLAMGLFRKEMIR